MLSREESGKGRDDVEAKEAGDLIRRRSSTSFSLPSPRRLPLSATPGELTAARPNRPSADSETLTSSTSRPALESVYTPTADERDAPASFRP
jgi:hypothetical protein